MLKADIGFHGSKAPSNTRLFEEIETDPNDTGDLSPDAGDAFVKEPEKGVTVDGQIAGRVPASNGAMGLIHGLDSNLGAGMRIAAFRGLKEIGLGFIESLYENSGGDYELPQNTALALKYEEKSYDPGHRYLKEDPVRKACDESFRRDGRDVIWVETKGIAEIGGGEGGTLPLGGLADASANFNVSGIFKYRRLEPFESASGKLLAGQAFSNSANIPITASLARRMPPGGEFELTAEGSVSLNPEVARPYGVKDKLGSLGASASVAGKHDRKNESTISVQRLPFGEEVLVKISTCKTQSNSIGAALKAGLELKKDAVGKLPEIGRGFLKFVLDRLKLPDAQKTVKKYFLSRAQIKARKENQEVETARYVFDLSKPEVRKAYEDIFTRFSLAAAKEHIAREQDGIKSQHAGEKVSLSETGAAAVLGPTKLFLLSALKAEREGKVSADGRTDVIYRDSKYEKTYVNWLHGEQKIRWEAVTVEGAKHELKKQNYFHLLYTNSDRMTTEKEIDHLLRFANGVGIPSKNSQEEDPVNPEVISKVLADRDDTTTRVDLYFTDTGIKNIADAKKEEARDAYLAAECAEEGKEVKFDCEAVQRYEEIGSMWFFKRVFYWGEMSRLKTQYESIAPGRSIIEDSKVLREARAFSEKVEMLNGSEESFKKFFMNLAAISGFQFMRSVAALSRLAGVDDTILHELSISGGGLTLAAVDEGEILHPEKAMHRMLTKIA